MSAIKGFYKNKFLLQLLNSFDSEYNNMNINPSNEKEINKYFNEKLNKKIKIKLNEQNINNLICCFIPLTYENKKNTIDDVFGNFIAKLNNNDGVNVYINKNKNIRDLGGINNLLPIIELMISSLKEKNPYKFLDSNILSEKNFQEFLIIIQKILIDHKNNIINENETHFISCLSLFMEKIPSKFYTLNILQSIIDLINLPLDIPNEIKILNNNENINLNSNNFINLILLNDLIITKFTPKAQIELWEGLYDIFKNDLLKLKKTLSTPKIFLLLRFYDEKRYEKFCCYKHACLFNNGNIYENKNNIMNPEMNFKVGKLFDIIQLYIDSDKGENQVEDIFKLLALDLSPCLQKKIINLYISHFNNNHISDNHKERTLDNLLKKKYIELSEYVLKISLLDVRIEIFKLFKLFITKYQEKIQEHLQKYSIDISQIFCFYGFNILPDKLIIEINNDINENTNNLISKEKIRKENTINEELLNDNKKYVHLIDFFDIKEYEKDIKSFWSTLESSFKYELIPTEKNNILKDKNYAINSFVFNFTMDFVSKISAFYVEEFLILLISALKDETISNRNLFYSEKIFFPWLIDTIFYFHNKKNYEYIKDKDSIISIQKLSVDILCELFSHRREKEEIFRKLKYILDYSYYYKKLNKGNKLKEIIRITRYLLIKTFECFNDFIDIKSKICFEFMFLYNNSETIFINDEFQVKEITAFPEKEFLEPNKNARKSIRWESVENNNNYDINNRISDNENDKDNDEDNDIDEEDNNNIGSINDSNNKVNNVRSGTIMIKNNSNKNDLFLGEAVLIPDFIYNGINYAEEISLFNNNENKLENSWSDFKLFYNIVKYYKKNLWGLGFLCKMAKVENSVKNFDNISKVLYRFYGELKENKNCLINEILKYINFQDKKKIKLNIFYINLILLSIAIDICDKKEEKEDLYNEYKQYLFFFILASINLSPNTDNKNKNLSKSNYYLQKMFYNIIGYGFLFLQKRDEEKYNEIKETLISPIFSTEKKNIFGISKKSFLNKSTIGKLFKVKDNSNLLKDDLKLDKNESQKISLHRSTRSVTTFSKNGLIFNKIKSGNININKNDNIVFKGDSNLIINDVIENTIKYYKNSKVVYPNSNILEFYSKKDEKIFIGMGLEELDKKLVEEEKRIFKTIKETIPFLEDEIRKYCNNSCLDQLKRRREYKKTKKRLFSWNGFWSDRKLFLGHPEYLKLQVKNHFTKEMTKVILTPILDIDYYLPQFSKFNKNKLFNKDDYKYKISLNVEEILKISDDNENEEEIIKNKNENNKNKNEYIKKIRDITNNINKNNVNIINENFENNLKIEEEKKIEKIIEKKDIEEKKEEKILINEIKKNKIIEEEKKENVDNIHQNLNIDKKIDKINNNNNKKITNFNDKIKFLNQRLHLNMKNPNPHMVKLNKNSSQENSINNIDNTENKIKIKNLTEKQLNENSNIKKEVENIILNKNIQNCLTKDFNYLESLYKYTFKGIWENYQKFYQGKGKMTLGKIILKSKDTFDILIQSKLMSSSEENKINENLYSCCIVKPTHHIKGYMSTEKTSVKFTHCEEDEESIKLLENDLSYDKELKCCFGSTFKSHIKDTEKICIEIKYTDMRYILFRNYFYQKTACEIYTFSNKSYFLNFKDNKEFLKFIDNILNHELFRPIKGEDFKGEKLLGYEKTSEIKPKSFKIKRIMEDWQNNNISTLEYIMWLNIFSGRSFNDLTQYPVLPWIITNYEKDELNKEDFRNLNIPIGMMEVSEKSEIRKETFIDFYNTLKTDFKDANPDFNYNEFLKKADEYLDEYKIKKNKKKKDNKDNNDVGLNDINISNIELNQIPYFFGTHYSCPTFVSHYLMRIFPFCLLSVEIQGDKFDDPDRIFISLTRTFETASTLKEDVRELIPEFYTLPDMFLNRNNLNLTQDKLDSEGKKIVVNDVELPPWCNNISYNFISEMRKNLENNELKINKWIDLIFGSLQRGEKAEENHNIFMAQSYEGMVKIDSVTDYDTRNALMRLCEVGITPKQIFKSDTKQKNEKIEMKGNYLYESKQLYQFFLPCLKYDEIIKKNYVNKSLNKEYEEQIYPKIIKIKYIGTNELLLMNNINYVTRLKFKKADKDKFIVDEKHIVQAMNTSSKYAPSYLMSNQDPPIIFYNKNKYMIKGGFWDGRLEINTIIIESKEKEKHFSNCIFINEGPIITMYMTKDEKILICGTKTGYLICLSVEGPNLEIIKKLYTHNDEITFIHINGNLNMFATSSLDGYINMHILPSFELIRSIKLSFANKNILYGNCDDEFYYGNNVFLSSSPLPCITAFISSRKIFRTYTINGEFVDDRQESDNSNYIKCPIVFNGLNFQDYLIYGTDDGRIKIRSFPNMDLLSNVMPYECNEIISVDISYDKKYCFLWIKDNKIICIKDFYVDIDNDEKKKIEKLMKEKEKEKDNENDIDN